MEELMTESAHRIERDSMGEMRISSEMLYGAQTERARQNFPISGLRFDRRFLQALGAIKRVAADVNQALDLLDGERADAIRAASSLILEIMGGSFV